MTAEQWTLVKSIFSEALHIDPDLRDEWLRNRVELPPAVVAEVVRLLAASESVTSLASVSPMPVPLTIPGLLVGQTLLNRFEVVSLLGSGAMGDVYCAFDRQVNEAVAFKTIRPHLAQKPELIASLTREVSLARRVVHENVCQIRDLHQEPNPPAGPLLFFTMELLPGRTLAEQLAERALTISETLQITRGMVHGIAAIHARSLIHRDLKPSNVFLVGAPGHAPRAVITDFGLCLDERRPVAETITAFGPDAVVGTPAYMAPEQLLGKGATQQSDIYSLGVLLFQMVTGHLPFAGETSLAIALRRLQQDAPEPRSLVKDLPPRWNAVIFACLQRDPARRPTSVLDVLAALEGRKDVYIPRVSRRTLLAGSAAALAATAAGVAVWRNRPVPHDPKPDAVYHFKLAQEFLRPSTHEGVQRAISELKLATQIDPLYTVAWSQLAEAYCMASTYSVIPSRDSLKLASAAARRALALDPDMGQAHAALASSLSGDIQHWRDAEPFFLNAIKLDPQNAGARAGYANFLGRACRPDEAILLAQSALTLEPGSTRFSYRLATELIRGRKFERARAHCEQFVQLHSEEASGHCLMSRCYEWLKQYDNAESQLKIADTLPYGTASHSYWATLYAATGRLHEAHLKTEHMRQAWLKQEEETNAYLYALGALAMRDPSTAQINEIAAVMQEGINRQDETILGAASNIYLTSIRYHPTLRPLFRQIGFDRA